MPFDPVSAGGSRAGGDLGTDGVAEIVAGAPAGLPPTIRTFRADGSRIAEFAAFNDGMRQGVNVALGDLDGDGKREIIAGSGPGAVAHAVVYGSDGKMRFLPGGIHPFGSEFLGGAVVAAGDLDGDGADEIITAAGPGGGPHVKAWKRDGTMLGEFFAFDEDERTGGLSIAAGDLDGDGDAEIAAALAGGSRAVVRIFAWGAAAAGWSFGKVGEFEGLADGFRGGLTLSIADADDDGANEIIAGTNGGGGPQVSVFGADGRPKLRFFAYDESYRGGVFAAAGAFGGGRGIVTVPAGRTADGRPHLAKYIHVDVSEQRLRAFEYGRLAKTFPVSTGLKKSPTPTGDFSITAKPLFVRYRGPGYDLGTVKWNLRFFPSYYIHNAPWHNNFGQRMSRGCVNVNAANAQWIYEWADEGTPVTVAD
jgi:hypothetical protein